VEKFGTVRLPLSCASALRRRRTACGCPAAGCPDRGYLWLFLATQGTPTMFLLGGGRASGDISRGGIHGARVFPRRSSTGVKWEGRGRCSGCHLKEVSDIETSYRGVGNGASTHRSAGTGRGIIMTLTHRVSLHRPPFRLTSQDRATCPLPLRFTWPPNRVR
jgi:hypothetical protein